MSTAAITTHSMSVKDTHSEILLGLNVGLLQRHRPRHVLLLSWSWVELRIHTLGWIRVAVSFIVFTAP